MKTIRVAHVFWGLGFGGIETMLVNIANAQAEYGADVHVVLINELYEKTLLEKLDSSVHVHLLNRKLGSKSLVFVWHLNKELRKMQPDKIHLHGPEFYAMIFGKKLSHKVSLTLHALPFTMAKHGSFWGMIKAMFSMGFVDGEQLVQRIPKLFAISNAVKEAFAEKYGVDSTVICNGILTANFFPKDQTAITPAYKLVQISRLDHDKKGQDLLIKAAAILKTVVDVTFIGDGESMEYLKKLTSDLDLEKNVHFLGKQSQEYIAKHLRNYDLFVQPSRREGFGLTVAEAMAAKVPVLVSSGQGPAEVTENDNYGWLFENGNADDLAEQIRFVFDHYDEALAKASLAKEHVCRHYDVSVTAKRYLELY